MAAFGIASRIEAHEESSHLAAGLIAGGGFATTATPGNQFVQTILVANKASFHPQIVNPEMVNVGIAIRPPGGQFG